MAKRKRLTPARTDVFASPAADGVQTDPVAGSAPITPPIAQVAGDAAVAAAFEEVTQELHAAQREGRMILSLPIDAIAQDYLIRDRLACDAEELDALKESLRRRGQQTPIEVTDLGQGRYGLISGWRRLRALRELSSESGGLQRYGQVQALLRLPEDRPAAYIAMVEENEVRADLSFYERARIVVQAVANGVFESDKHALQSLFSAASFSKRSKVKSFMPLVRALDGHLQHPAQIPERLGLSLAKLLQDEAARSQLMQALEQAAAQQAGPLTPDAERAVLEAALRPAQPAAEAGCVKPAKPRLPAAREIAPGLRMRAVAGRVELEGEALTEEMLLRLSHWLEQQG